MRTAGALGTHRDGEFTARCTFGEAVDGWLPMFEGLVVARIAVAVVVGGVPLPGRPGDRTRCRVRGGWRDGSSVGRSFRLNGDHSPQPMVLDDGPVFCQVGDLGGSFAACGSPNPRNHASVTILDALVFKGLLAPSDP